MQINDQMNTAALAQQTNRQAKEAASLPGATQAASPQSLQETAPTQQRDTFEIPILEQMSDEEYTAFLRATRGMSEAQTVQAAEGLNLIAESYKATQQVINGGLLSAMQSDEPSDLLADLAQGDLKAAIDQGAGVLGQMQEGDQVRLARLMERMAMALTQTGLNLQG